MKRGLAAMFFRDGKLFCASLFRAIALTLVFVAICGAGGYGMYTFVSESASAPVKLALIDGDNGALSRLAVGIVSSHEEISRLIDFERTDEESAKAGIADGKYHGAIMLPEGYIEALLDGEASQGTVFLGDGIMQSGTFIRRITVMGERIIGMGQNGVFSGARVLLSHNVGDKEYMRYIYGINDVLMNEASMGGERYVSETVTPYSSSSLPLTSHIALIYIMLSASLCTVLFYKSITADLAPALYSRTLSCGVGKAAFILPKIAYSFAFRFVLAAVSFAAFDFIAPVKLCFSGVCGLLAATAFLAALGTFLSISLSGSRYGVAVLSLSMIPEMFVCGGVVPLSSLSDKIASIGGFLPLGAAYGMSAPVVGGNTSLLPWLVAIAWLAVCGAFASIRLEKLTKEGGADL